MRQTVVDFFLFFCVRGWMHEMLTQGDEKEKGRKRENGKGQAAVVANE